MNDLEWLRFVGGHDECSFTITDQPPNLKTGDVVEIYDGTHKLFSGELTSWEIFSEFTGHCKSHEELKLERDLEKNRVYRK